MNSQINTHMLDEIERRIRNHEFVGRKPKEVVITAEERALLTKELRSLIDVKDPRITNFRMSDFYILDVKVALYE